MKKSLLILFALIVSLIGFSQTVGDTFVIDYITYEVTSVSPNTVKPIDYDMSGGTVVDIQTAVVNNVTTYMVTSIGNGAFQNNQLTHITIPNTVTDIGFDAFAFNQIMNVTIPTSVVSIGQQAFADNQLTSITIPNSVTNIGAIAFQFNQLTSVTIPNSITSIGYGTFGSNQLTSINIPNSVTNIDFDAFAYNNLTDVVIPESVTSIGSKAFGFNPLANVISLGTIPPTITTIETGFNDSFNSDRSAINLILTGNTTDEYVTNAGAQWTGFKMVFEATSATTAKVTDYDASNGLAVSIPNAITIPSVTTFNVTEIGDSAFYNRGITSVTIPDSVTDIGISAFELNSLTTVEIPNNVIVIGTTAFATNSIASLSLGNNVEIIGIGAFVDNNFTDITIPSNVIEIGLLAFGNNPLLANVTSLATVPPTVTTGVNDTFIFDRSNTALHIPLGTTDIYVTNPNTGADWSGFNPVTEDAVLSTTNFTLTNDVKVFTTTDTIKVISSNDNRLQNYTIYSITGAKVAIGTQNEIATSSFASGIYVLKLEFDRGTITKKVLVN
ncbi:leucine-rich repeat domain-containing protein [Winogradskyella psychrotolerans]|uniref:leucine-rich repeat domain-containing protein n=1 Tax=Winogradskyella psychrotolerans TaxID=1344585 RepID=UPI001C06DBB8|nr:leucine-rich repeat domain-containing protein [Winogradskyella psychrotolerans]MBU2930252.1 leucine-rich repeat domain-containing protein [Winogradskyella psychrotolerans]